MQAGAAASGMPRCSAVNASARRCAVLSPAGCAKRRLHPQLCATPTSPTQVLNRLGSQTANEWLGNQTARTAPTDVLKRIAGPRLLWQVGVPCADVLRRSALRCALTLLTMLQAGAISTPEAFLPLSTNQTVCLRRSWA